MNVDFQEANIRNSAFALPLRGVAGVLVASLVNAALFVATAPFAFPPDAIAPETGAPVGLTEVVGATVVGGAIAVAGFLLLRRFLPSLAQPRRAYLLAAVVLILLAYGPFTIRNVGAAQILVMQLMHIVTGLLPLRGMLGSGRR
jgi:hypothetical protein